MKEWLQETYSHLFILRCEQQTVSLLVIIWLSGTSGQISTMKPVSLNSLAELYCCSLSFSFLFLLRHTHMSSASSKV